MEKATQLEIAVQIAKTSVNVIDKKEYFVIEGISEVGVFIQYLPIALKENFDENETEYTLVFELKKDKNKHGIRVVDLVA